MQANKKAYDSKESILALWCHENFRIFGDRMWDPEDKKWLQVKLDEKLNDIFAVSWDQLFPSSGEIPIHVSFMKNADDISYEAVTNITELKNVLMDRLEDYNAGV